MNRKQKRTLGLLAALVAVLIALLLGVRACSSAAAKKQAAEDAAQTRETLTEADLKFSAISYTNETATLSFAVNEEGNWYWVDDPEFPLNGDALTQLSGTLAGLTPQQTITDGDTLEAYGLTEPAVTLTATGTNGSTLTLGMGNATTDGQSFYLLKDGDESTVYIIDGALHTQLTRGIYEMMALPELPVLAESDLRSITLSGGAETALRAIVDSSAADAEASAEAQTTVSWRAQGANVTDNPDVAAMVGELTGLTLDHCEVYRPSAKTVSVCGFDTPTCVISVEYGAAGGETKSTLTLTVGNRTAAGDCRFVRINHDATLYAVTEESLQTLLRVAESGLSQ